MVSLPPLWLSPLVDLCLVPTEAAREQALAAGHDPERVKVVGQPISLKFSRPQPSKSKLRSDLGLRKDLPTVLVAGGGEGMGNIKDVAAEIGSAGLPIQLVVITGKNWRLRKKLAARRWEVPTAICGFVDDMHRWMAASDVIVTKPGPSTIAEALALGVPLILCGNVMGQEEGNVTYVVGSGAGVYVPDVSGLISVLKEWLRPDNHTLEEITQRARQIGRPDSVLTVAREAVELWEQSLQVDEPEVDEDDGCGPAPAEQVTEEVPADLASVPK
jgi:1,2-diacylglycerol 3-beta-galactosyltransferase